MGFFPELFFQFSSNYGNNQEELAQKNAPKTAVIFKERIFAPLKRHSGL